MFNKTTMLLFIYRSQVTLGNAVLTALRSVIHQFTLLYSQKSLPVVV